MAGLEDRDRDVTPLAGQEVDDPLVNDPVEQVTAAGGAEGDVPVVEHRAGIAATHVVAGGHGRA